MKSNPLVLKLGQGAPLTAEDCEQLLDACANPRHINRQQDIICEGERPDDVHVILSGFACRYKANPEGSRQNLAILVPGDFCDLHVAILDRMDHSIATLSACTVVNISRNVILRLLHTSPQITRALWWCTLVDEAILREWLAGMGLRLADQQLAHLLCELLVRLQAVGMAGARSYALPFTQREMAETLGISTVHMNRVLQELREAKLVEWKNQEVTIPDPEQLKRFCGFTANYLHLGPRDGRRAGNR